MTTKDRTFMWSLTMTFMLNHFKTSIGVSIASTPKPMGQQDYSAGDRSPGFMMRSRAFHVACFMVLFANMGAKHGAMCILWHRHPAGVSSCDHLPLKQCAAASTPHPCAPDPAASVRLRVCALPVSTRLTCRHCAAGDRPTDRCQASLKWQRLQQQRQRLPR